MTVLENIYDTIHGLLLHSLLLLYLAGRVLLGL